MLQGGAHGLGSCRDCGARGLSAESTRTSLQLPQLASSHNHIPQSGQPLSTHLSCGVGFECFHCQKYYLHMYA